MRSSAFIDCSIHLAAPFLLVCLFTTILLAFVWVSLIILVNLIVSLSSSSLFTLSGFVHCFSSRRVLNLYQSVSIFFFVTIFSRLSSNFITAWSLEVVNDASQPPICWAIPCVTSVRSMHVLYFLLCQVAAPFLFSDIKSFSVIKSSSALPLSSVLLPQTSEWLFTSPVRIIS